MIRSNIQTMEKLWLSKYEKMNARDKLFLEILTFSFIGTQAEKSDIFVEKNEIDKLINGEIKTCYQYTITVTDEESNV